VNCELFTPGQSSREEFDLPPDKKIVLMVSALYPRKRVNLGIEAIHKLDNVHLVVAGDGPLRPELELQASRLLPGRFTCLSIPSERMPTLYRSADVLLHLAREESFGNIFVEALACGLPIVAQDSLRVRWIVGDTEFLVDTADVNAIAEGIDAALDSPPSRQAHRVARAKTFSWPRIGEMYHSFLQQVVNSA
jgi:glycosyltransferase involved in cell wall biosynthesis